MSAAFQYSEALFAEETGLSRGEAKYHRDQILKEGVDWKKERGEVVLSASAIKRVWRVLQGRPAPFELSRCLVSVIGHKNGADKKNDASILLGSSARPIPRKMKVLMAALNPRVVRAVDQHGDNHLVWVGSNSNFVHGDLIDVVPHDTQPPFWRFIGPMPRDRRRVRQ